MTPFPKFKSSPTMNKVVLTCRSCPKDNATTVSQGLKEASLSLMSASGTTTTTLSHFRIITQTRAKVNRAFVSFNLKFKKLKNSFQ